MGIDADNRQIFPFGLTMVIVTGTDLCTGSFMLTTIAALQRRISVVKMLQHWFISTFTPFPTLQISQLTL